MLSSFPATAGDPDVLLRVYFEDTKHVPEEIVAATAIRYRQGRVQGQSRKFAPTPAEFIAEAEETWKLEKIRNRPRLAPPAHVQRGSYFERQQAVRDRYGAFPVLADGLTTETYQKMLKRQAFTHPHFFVASLGTVYSGLHPAMAAQAPKPARAFHEVES